MMLLNKNRDKSLFIQSAIIWLFAYSGYLYRPFLVQWDNILNISRLYQLWYMNFFVTHYVLKMFTTIKESQKIQLLKNEVQSELQERLQKKEC
jgi:hypothetical protein